MLRYFQRIKQELNKVKAKGSFIQNVSIVFSGNVINFLLQIGFSPVLSRVFTPEAYGEYAFINLVITNITFLGGLSLPSVYVIQENRQDFLNLAKGVFTLTFIISLISMSVYSLFEGVFFHTDLKWYIVAGIFLIILLNSLNNILGSYNQREKKYVRNTSSGVFSNVISKPSSLLMGLYVTSSGFGLFFGDLLKSIVLFIIQTKSLVKFLLIRALCSYGWVGVIRVFKSNINVPKYIFPSQLINKWIADIPIVLIGVYFDKSSLGAYVFAATILNIPQNLFSKAIQPVFFQKVSEVNKIGRSEVGYLIEKIVIISLIISIVPICIVQIWSSDVFVFVFGEKWELAGEIVSLSAFYYILSAITVSFQGIRRVIKLEKKTLQLTIIGSVVKMIPMLLLFANISFNQFIFISSLFNASYIIYNLADLFYSVLTKNRALRLTLFIIGAVSLSVLTSIASLIQ